MEQSKDLYDILEISNKEADQDEIEEAFYRKAYRLERAGATEEAKREAYDAYVILFNPIRKEAYDKGLAHGSRKGYEKANQERQEEARLEGRINDAIYDALMNL